MHVTRVVSYHQRLQPLSHGLLATPRSSVQHQHEDPSDSEAASPTELPMQSSLRPRQTRRVTGSVPAYGGNGSMQDLLEFSVVGNAGMSGALPVSLSGCGSAMPTA